MSETMTREQLLQEFADAYEQLIRMATEAAQRGVTRQGDTWGPREIVAHLAGWEVMATVRIPRITAAGIPPIEFGDATRTAIMNDAINTAFVMMAGDQPLETVCGLLRQAYQRDVEILSKLDDMYFQPGEYVFERTKNAIDHCQEHMEALVPSRP